MLPPVSRTDCSASARAPEACRQSWQVISDRRVLGRRVDAGSTNYRRHSCEGAPAAASRQVSRAIRAWALGYPWDPPFPPGCAPPPTCRIRPPLILPFLPCALAASPAAFPARPAGVRTASELWTGLAPTRLRPEHLAPRECSKAPAGVDPRNIRCSTIARQPGERHRRAARVAPLPQSSPDRLVLHHSTAAPQLSR